MEAQLLERNGILGLFIRDSVSSDITAARSNGTDGERTDADGLVLIRVRGRNVNAPIPGSLSSGISKRGLSKLKVVDVSGTRHVH